MNPEEYDRLARIEECHWFYRGKREIVQHWIARSGPWPPGATLLDCGAGTGRFAAGLAGRFRVRVLDDHAESLAHLRRRFGAEAVVEAPCTAVPLPDGTADVVTALDVIEHVDDDAAALREFHRLLRPGGVLIVTVPALRALWSDWDVALHHRRRYDRRGLRDRIVAAGFAVEHLAYINVAALPADWLVRRRRGGRPPAGPRAEDRVPPGPVNWLLRQLFVVPACAGLPAPAGVGLLAVVRRPGGPS